VRAPIENEDKFCSIRYQSIVDHYRETKLVYVLRLQNPSVKSSKVFHPGELKPSNLLTAKETMF